MESAVSEPAQKTEASNHDVTVAWLDELADGKPSAVEQFWERYGESLQRVAERQIAGWLRRRVDPEDVVQSACRTFFRRAGDGNFSLESKDDLWKLLLTITLNKVRMQARFHTRNRRSVSKEQAIPDEANLHPGEWDHAIENVELNDMLDVAFADKDDERRRVLEMWLDGRTQNEIASEVGCSERTVRRIQQRIRDDLKSYLSDDEETLAGGV
ncbi:MAG: sigma-70 family RNA polymerase sigma factor [Planctomycetota bacterium]